VHRGVAAPRGEERRGGVEGEAPHRGGVHPQRPDWGAIRHAPEPHGGVVTSRRDETRSFG